MSEHARDPAGLERQLRSLESRDDLFPATPDIAGHVASRTAPASTSTHRPHRFGAGAWRMAAVIALVLLALVAALAVPASRTAIAGFFGIEGIRIETGREEPAGVPATPASIGGSLLLGERTTLPQARAAAGFDVMVPARGVTDDPDEVYLNQRSGVAVAGLLWRANDALPEIGDTGVGMLLLELDAPGGGVLFVKQSMMSGYEVQTTRVNDGTGYWVENGVLAVAPVDGLMFDVPEPGRRRSGNVLIWSDDGVTYRLESSLPLEDAVRIAESLSPADS